MAAQRNPLGLKVRRITARVHDIESAVSWYRDVLGLEVGERGTLMAGAMKYAYLHLPDFAVSLVQLAMPAIAVAAGQAVLPSWIHPVIAVPDPDTLFRRFREQGVDVKVRGKEPERVTTFLCYDPDGNELEFIADGAP